METKNQGTVKFFNTEKGFGFIRHDDSDKETFVHVSGLINEIKDDVKEISLRTLIAVSKIRASNKDWKDLATYMLTA